MNTGEDQQGLHRILDMTRMISVFILILHCYACCYQIFERWGIFTNLTNHLLANFWKMGLLTPFQKPKWIALGLLIISLFGACGRKTEHLTIHSALTYLLTGCLLYFASYFIFYLFSDSITIAILYISITFMGYLLILRGGTLISRVIRNIPHNQDIFNIENESFPQEERRLNNPFSINLPATYRLKGQQRASWINIINPFRSLLVMGSPGSGKSYFIIQHLIKQHIEKGFSMFVYDFKFDDLSLIAYNHLLKHNGHYPVKPRFYVINFDRLSHSHRCNPLDKENMLDLTDAAESARTILLGLNRDWIKRQGDFFVESPINFLTAIIWFLRKYKDGEYCTLPHVIELMQVEYDRLFSILSYEKEIEILINPFVSAYQNNAMEQLEGQIASAKIAMARLSSPQLYYILSGNDFRLDINNPREPKLLCAGNNPQKIQIYGAVLSLYVNRLIKMVNQKGKLKSSLVFDEFPTLYLNHIDGLMATARGNLVATCLGIQDFSQLKKDYGKDMADVILNITGNIVSGQVSGETARHLSERFGRILQEKTSVSINSTDSSVNYSQHLDLAVPASKIASLSAGEFVGMVADDPGCPIELKGFHNRIQNNHKMLLHEKAAYQPLPQVREINPQMIQLCYEEIKTDINKLVESSFAEVIQSPDKSKLITKRNE